MKLQYGDWVQDGTFGLVWVVVKHIKYKNLFSVKRLKEDGTTDQTWILGSHLTKLPESICKILSDSIKFPEDSIKFPEDSLFPIRIEEGEDDVKNT